MKEIILPKPQTVGGMPLMEALAKRCSRRTYSEEELSLQTLSDLLWSAFGFNRESKRTAPSSHNRQEAELYLFLKEGVYLYDAGENILRGLIEGDLRALTGTQEFVAEAPVNVAIICDSSKITGKTPQGVIETIYTDAGFISENIYLYATSAGLISVTRALVDKPVLSQRLGLRPEQVITLIHTVGYPKSER